MNTVSSSAMLATYLPVLWSLLIAVAVMMYVILDGFDLGIGILFPTTRDEGDRDLMMNSIAPFWDGNETWLVLGGAGLLVAFPTAYSIIMPAFYLPVIVMLLALIFRGVSFEFRAVSKPHHAFWDLTFWGGSTLAAFAQGIILGGLIQGIRIKGDAFAGGPFDWATPFALACGVGLVFGYALIGATWLIFKTGGAVQARARRQARVLLVIVFVGIVLVSIWTPLLSPRIASRWFAFPNIFFLWPVPLLTAGLGWLVWRGLENERELTPFIGTIGLFVLAYFGLAVSTFPLLVPPSLTIWQTAAVPDSQFFSLLGTMLMLPIVLGYFAFMFWTFRAKVTAESGYH
jgi:cytochrome d ubiquinol oxidase subunit II